MDDFLFASSLSSLLHLIVAILLIAGVSIMIIALGERALGFSLKGAIDDIEKAAGNGNVWPVTALICVGMAVVGFVLGHWLG